MLHTLRHSLSPVLMMVCSLLLVALASCQRNEVYMEYLPVNTADWDTNDRLEFDLSPVPEDGMYVLSVELRTTEANIYPYKDLLLEVRQLWSKEDDAEQDSLYHLNDSLCEAHRIEMAEDERLIAHNNQRVGFNRRAQLQAQKEEQSDQRRREKAEKKAKKSKKKKDDKDKDDKKKDDRKKGDRKKAERDTADEPPRMTRRDSIIAVTDSLIKAIDLLQVDIWRMESMNDSIDLDRAHRVSADTVEFRFDIPDRDATGIVVRQYNMPVRVLSLLKGQTAHITLRHIMRLQTLPGISDIGITLEKQ